MIACKCGCGEPVKKGRAFVNKEHQLDWMARGGAREMNALQSEEAKIRGGHSAGRQAADSGRLRDAGLLGAEKARELSDQWRAKQARDSALGGGITRESKR